MRLEKLKMQGFGSYASEQELNFQAALKFDHMFVISGKTGAGKTMIFDAIHYALYGQASGADRQEKMLKSDFLPSGVCPFVELTFTVRGETYTVYRSLAYEKKRARGEGFTIEGPKASLRLPDGFVHTKISVVNEEIERILGFHAQQFKQLVMIPQGEFKKLLLAKSDERTKIFQKIFGTYLYEAIQMRAKEEANAIHKAVADKQAERLNRMHAFELMVADEQVQASLQMENPNLSKTIEIFQAELEKEQAALEKMEQTSRICQDELAILNQRLSLARTIGELVEKQGKYQADLTNLKQQKVAEEEKKSQLTRAKQAKIVHPFYMKKLETTALHLQVAEQLEIENQTLQGLQESYLHIQGKLEAAKAGLQLKPKLQEKKEEIVRIREIVMQYEEVQNKRAGLCKEQANYQKQIEELTMKLQENRNEIAVLARNLTEIIRKKEEKSQLLLTQLADEKRYEQEVQCLERIADYFKQVEEQEELQAKFLDMESARREKKHIYENMQLQYDRNLAGLMAKHLQEGEACLVCGSTVHPNPAQYKGELIEKDDIEDSKQAYEEEARYQAYIQQLEKQKTALAMQETGIEDLLKKLQLEGNLQVVQVDLHGIAENRKQRLEDYHTRLSTLDDEMVREADYGRQKEGLETEVDVHQQRVEEIKQMVASLRGQEKNLEEACMQYEEKLAGQVVSVDTLNLQERELVKQMQEIDDKLEEIRNQSVELNGQVEKQKGVVQGLQNRKQDLEMEKKKSVWGYQEALSEQDFQEENELLQSYLPDEVMGDLQEWLTDYHNACAEVKTYLDGLQSQLKGLYSQLDGQEIQSVSVLSMMIDEKEQEIHALQAKQTDLFHMYKKNEDIRNDVIRLTKGIEEKEKVYGEIARIAKVLNGDNQQKISFERYVLSAYFEQIIDAANLRLGKMTQQRYELMRKVEVGDKRKASGLDLQVRDDYTGKLRDISTLSGGESFKAALAMALGLADVVQAFAGGIQMDTIFIDEGFGSLDAEALDTAIDCLTDLQSEGRIVGVISHVEELKNRMPVRLEVVQRRDGSHAKFTKWTGVC